MGLGIDSEQPGWSPCSATPCCVIVGKLFKLPESQLFKHRI